MGVSSRVYLYGWDSNLFTYHFQRQISIEYLDSYTCRWKGWTSNVHRLMWLHRCFKLCTWEKVNGKIQLLISNRYGSHVTLKFIIHYMFYDIILMILLPHTLHLTQPLEVAIFLLLKQHTTAELYRIIETEIAWLQKAEWLSTYIQARERAFCISNILSAFSEANLFPFNCKKVLRRIPSSIVSQTIQNMTPDTDISPFQYPFLTSSPNKYNNFSSS